MNLLAELPGDTHVHIPGAQVRQQRMVAQRQHDHIRHRLPDVRLGTGQRETGRRQGVRPALYHTEGFTHAAEPVEPQDQLDDAAALRQGEVVPFVQLVIHLERGHLLFPERGQIPILVMANPDRHMAERLQKIDDTDSLCF